MQWTQLVILGLCLALLGCGSRPGSGSGPTDGGTERDGAVSADGTPRDGPACPSPAPAEGASCSFDPTKTCAYVLPGPCPGAENVCRCMNGSWHCEVALLDGGPCGDPLDGPLAAFCSGGSARMVVNGIDSGPAVTGTALPLNCCDAAEFVVVTQTVPSTMVPIVVSWRAQVGPSTTFPATIDLANPPHEWGVQVNVGCDPAQGTCNPAPDSYTTGLGGTLQVARSSAGGYDMSLCLSVAEPAGSPHPIVHSLQLYAPNVATHY